MNCNESNEYIMKYFDRDLNDIESAQLKQHLKSCKKCSEDFQSMNKIINCLENESILEMPENFEMDVMSKIKCLEVDRKKKSSRNLVFLYNLITLVSVVALLAFIINLKDVNIFDTLSYFRENFKSFSSIIEILYQVFNEIYSVVAGVISILLAVGVLIYLDVKGKRADTDINTK